MSRVTKNLVQAALSVAVLLVPALPAYAQGIGFRNDLKGPVIVQGASTAGLAVRIGPPILIAPGKVGWDNKLPPGIRQITIRDALQPNVILFRDNIKFDGRNDLAFIILMDGPKIILKPAP